MDLFKRVPYRNKKITKSARGESCTLRLDGCDGGGETTVWAHSNFLEDGKGTSQKADDIFGCYACANCHDILDRRKRVPIGSDEFLSKEELRDQFHRAMKVSIRRLLDNGVIS